LSTKPLEGFVVGLGVMGLNHLRVLEGIDDVRIVALVDPDPDRLCAAPAGERVRRCSGLDAALEESRPDFVCLATPVGSLPSLARQTLGRGIAVLVEKPMAPDEESAQALIRLAGSRRLPLAIGHVERFNPAVGVAKAEIDAGRIGQVYELRSHRRGPASATPASVGVALDLATHDLDVMRHLTGAEVERVAAREVREEGALATESLLGIVRFDTGAIGVLDVSRVAPQKVRKLLVTGARGTLALDYLAQAVVLHERGSAPLPLRVLHREPLRVQWEAFLRALRHGTPPEVDGYDGLAALSTARALQFSAARRTTVVPAYRALEEPLRAAI
jgi:UDP-N-acetylglucosamine 3-dehydrogenase